MALLSFLLIINPSLSVVSGILSAMAHEMGHIIMMLYCGRKITGITINPFNIDIIDSERALSDYRSDLIILLSGPAVNIAAFIFLKLIFSLTYKPIFNLVSYQNLFLGIINLLPFTASDGGQILFILLNRKFSLYTCNIICQCLSCVILIPLAVLGFLILFSSKYNFTLLFVCCYLMLFMVLKENGLY